ncbi:MAG: isoprenylcysteine carboxylmethyltransferase family protein [Actinomycetales bacterium]|nr:isoprenylcysteine carboxylmethyltransferase family protein [Actinomycetales bacterium]
MNRGVIGWLLVAAQFVLLIALVLLPREVPTLARLAVGVPLAAAGIVLGLVSFRHLGNALTPTPVPIEGAGLRTSGAYRYVRHPIYSSILLMAAGYACMVGTAWTWVGVGVLVVFFLAKSRWEDALLAEAYGPQWTDWASHTGALVPRMNRGGQGA